MSPGAVEEGGEVARSLIGNLKDSPITLALVVFNILFLIVVYFSIRDQRQQLANYDNKMFEQQAKVMDMLYHCVPPPPKPPESQ